MAKQLLASILLLTGIWSCLCGGCVAGFSRSHFGTGGMGMAPGTNPMDDPHYVRLLRIEKQGRALQIGGIIGSIGAGAYLLFARLRVKRQPPTPDTPSESN